jgi:ankyrin repeat protein
VPTPAQRLLDAVLAGDAGAVAALLDADPLLRDLAERSSKRRSVLQIAAARGDLAIVELLLAAGASPNKRSHDGSSPLHEAARCGHLEVVRALLAAGAETRCTTNDGYSPLNFAGGHPAIFALLMTLPRPTQIHTFRGKREWS